MKHAKQKQAKTAGHGSKKGRKGPTVRKPSSEATRRAISTTARPRDPRLPAAGTTLVRPYKGKDYRIEVLDNGFRYDGRAFRSLSKLASEITGQPSINGFLWMRLTERPTALAAKQEGVAKRAAASPKGAEPKAAPAAGSATA